jgi:hypothetical protein
MYSYTNETKQKHSKYKYTYFQNTHTIVKTLTHYKTQAYTHPQSYIHIQINKLVKLVVLTAPSCHINCWLHKQRDRRHETNVCSTNTSHTGRDRRPLGFVYLNAGLLAGSTQKVLRPAIST